MAQILSDIEREASRQDSRKANKFGQKQADSDNKVFTKASNCADVFSRPSENIVERFEWQRASDDLLLFSAHYDPRLLLSPRVVTIGLKSNYTKAKGEYDVSKTKYGVSHVWFRNEARALIVSADMIIPPQRYSKR